MVKKQQKTAAPKPAQGRRKNAASASPASSKAADTPFAEQVRTSAQQIWSAGLAAFAKAQDQGGAAVGKAEARIDTAAHRMSDLAGEVGARAGQHWDKLESIFEDRVARALTRLGMPAADEVAQLKARVEALSAEVAMLRAAQSGAAPQKPVAKKATTKKATSTNTASTKAPVTTTAVTKTAVKKAAVKKPAAKAAKPAKAARGGKRTT
ncbi:phasin family protein [Roseateles chitinivorans]|uniref:phasin family protein n=1 Tax=Roseateles chitinivorans TaxID=2917965 RepID=UPI003D66EDBC